ncbi:phosphotransferase [Candidatus Poribacteria bacterium]
MKIELDIDKAALAERIHQEYGIQIESLTFVPKGEVAYGYIVHCATDDRYFLKLFSDSRLAQIGTRHTDLYLPLTWNLHSKGLLPNVPYPIKTRNGDLKTDFDDQPLILFNFIDGEVPGCDSPLSDDIVMKLARLVGILHRSTPEIGIDFTNVEYFDIPFEDDLLNGFDALEHITEGDNQGKRELRELLLPRKDEILGYLDRLKELQKMARAIGKEKVLCHTDLHGDNLIVDHQGNLHILDWEGAMLAPPEHDLFFFAWEDRFIDVFLTNYQHEFGPVSLDSNVFGFYYYRRNLEDLTDWIIRILYENTDEEQNRYDLDGIIEDCISGWPYLESTIKNVHAKLI